MHNVRDEHKGDFVRVKVEDRAQNLEGNLQGIPYVVGRATSN
jgi:hypothetical protein